MAYMGKWLHLDLSSGRVETGEPDPLLLEKYIGGKGLGFALLERLAPSPDPYGPENPLIFINGPFTGTRVQTSARTCLVTRSPLTGSIHDSHCGGYFGPRFKAAGYDYMIITGKAEKPVYIHLTPERIAVEDASDLWGQGIFRTDDELRRRHPGKNPRVACIGPAGEKLSRIACIGSDKYRQFGRGGTGAVMGSKNLKAIIVDGNLPIRYHDEDIFNTLNKQLTQDILDHDGVKFRRQKGTMKWIRQAQEYELLPTRNFKKVQFEHFESISSEASRKELNWKDVGCFNCVIQCSKIAKWDGHEIEGPEYETAAFLGSGCEIKNIKDVTLANEICDDLGMDTISAGVTCSFAMECYEKGLIQDWGGLKLEWGSAEAQREFLRQMTFREGVGKIFADGTRVAAGKIGRGSEDFAINTFGMELSGVNPKGCLTMGFALSVADFASHTRLWMTEAEMGPGFKIEDIPASVADGLDEINTRNSLIICDFVPYGLDRLAPIFTAATGIDHTPESLMDVGARISNLARMYNLRNGRRSTDDILPGRFFKEESLSGFMRGKKLDREFFLSLIQEYYALRGWSPEGEPTRETLQKYGL
ncbi:MAG: aldehyde ferredoxin oxidoreductase family protein [Candidatus Aminicenantaceae bacterium]